MIDNVVFQGLVIIDLVLIPFLLWEIADAINNKKNN